MFRLVWTFLILSVSLYADGSCFVCQPDVFVVINGVDYSSSFVPVTTDDGATWSIAGDITNDTFTFSLNVTTHTDPDIDFDTSISGDPTVGIRITQTFLGGPLFNLTTTSSGVIEDLGGNGQASVVGVFGDSQFIQRTTVVGLAVIEQNTGCNLTLDPFPPTLCGDSQLSQTVLIPNGNPLIPLGGILIMDIGFTLSDFDKFTLNGNATLNPVPEPAAMIPLMAGMFAMAGIAWRRNRNRIGAIQ